MMVLLLRQLMPGIRRRRSFWRFQSIAVRILTVSLAIVMVLHLSSSRALATGGDDDADRRSFYIRWPPPSTPDVRLGAFVHSLRDPGRLLLDAGHRVLAAGYAARSQIAIAMPTVMASMIGLLMLRNTDIQSALTRLNVLRPLHPPPSVMMWALQEEQEETKGWFDWWILWFLLCAFILGAAFGVASRPRFENYIRNALGMRSKSLGDDITMSTQKAAATAAKEAAREAELNRKLDCVVLEKNALIQEWGQKEQGLQAEMRRLAMDSKAKGERIGVLEAQEQSLRSELHQANTASLEISRLGAELSAKCQQVAELQEQLAKASAAAAAAQAQLALPQMQAQAMFRRLREIEERGNISFKIKTGELLFAKEAAFVQKRVGVDAPTAEFANTRESTASLKDVAEACMLLGAPLVVEGHTQPGGENNPDWVSELRYNRAQLIVSTLVSHGVPAEMMTAKAAPAGHPGPLNNSSVVLRFADCTAQQAHAANAVRAIARPAVVRQASAPLQSGKSVGPIIPHLQVPGSSKLINNGRSPQQVQQVKILVPQIHGRPVSPSPATPHSAPHWRSPVVVPMNAQQIASGYKKFTWPPPAQMQQQQQLQHQVSKSDASGSIASSRAS